MLLWSLPRAAVAAPRACALAYRPPLAAAPALQLIVTRPLAKKAKAKKKGGGGSGEVADSEAAGGGGVDEESLKLELAKPLAHLRREYSGMQIGRAKPSMLDAVQVDTGAGAAPLPSLGKVLAQGPQALTVSLFDTGAAGAVVKAIAASPLGLRPEQQGKVVKVHVPRPTQEAREAMAAQAKVHRPQMRALPSWRVSRVRAIHTQLPASRLPTAPRPTHARAHSVAVAVAGGGGACVDSLDPTEGNEGGEERRIEGRGETSAPTPASQLRERAMRDANAPPSPSTAGEAW